MCSTCFGLYLGHPQTCHYKNLIKEDTISISEAHCLQSLIFVELNVTKYEKYWT
jgi:hypothetical protein